MLRSSVLDTLFLVFYFSIFHSINSLFAVTASNITQLPRFGEERIIVLIDKLVDIEDQTWNDIFTTQKLKKLITESIYHFDKNWEAGLEQLTEEGFDLANAPLLKLPENFNEQIKEAITPYVQAASNHLGRDHYKLFAIQAALVNEIALNLETSHELALEFFLNIINKHYTNNEEIERSENKFDGISLYRIYARTGGMFRDIAFRNPDGIFANFKYASHGQFGHAIDVSTILFSQVLMGKFQNIPSLSSVLKYIGKLNLLELSKDKPKLLDDHTFIEDIGLSLEEVKKYHDGETVILKINELEIDQSLLNWEKTGLSMDKRQRRIDIFGAIFDPQAMPKKVFDNQKKKPSEIFASSNTIYAGRTDGPRKLFYSLLGWH